MSDAMYRVEKDGEANCQSYGDPSQLWTIVDNEGVAVGQSWGDKELAEDICDHMNSAYDRGLENKS